MSDAGGQSRSPTAAEVLRQALSYALSDVHTLLPGRIEEYTAAEGKVAVKPLIQRLSLTEDGEEILEELPIIPDVPVVFPRTQTAFLSLPIKKGDLCAIIFAERSLDNWLASPDGEDTDPDEFRQHDLTDAVCVPGLYPFSKAIVDIDEANLVVGFDEGGLQVHITPDGTMEVKVNGDADEVVALGNALQTFWDTVVTPWMVAHTHPTGVGPSGPPVQAGTFPAFDTAILSTILKVKSG